MEDSLIAVRLAKHQELNGGAYPLATGVGTKIKSLLTQMRNFIPAVSLDPSQLGEDYLVHGRIIAIRRSGGISFIKIFDSTGAIQLIASKSVLEDYPQLRLLDLGDILEVTGKICLSKTNEPSLLVMNWSVLTKSHRAPPEKYLGISNVETKYRKRYLDLMSSEESRAVFTIRSYTLRALRDFMEKLDFMEVETSTLNTVNSGANALPFITRHHHLETDLFLRIAPELYLKRLLVGGYDKVFEIGRNYRNEGVSTRHNPEFTMMEFYETYGSFQDLIDYTKGLLQHVDSYLEKHLRSNFAYPYLQEWKSKRTFTFSKFKELTMAEAVANACTKLGITIKELGIYIEDIDNLQLKKIDVSAVLDALEGCSSPGELTSILFEHLAEPFLTEDYREVIDGVSYSVPVFITQYPVEICPLARKNDQNPDVCDRFELFVDGRELCNAFQELNDPDEQARRFQEQLELNQKDPMGYDEDYVEALEYSMPPSIGFGMGIDRLAMLLTNSASIKDVILFPTLKKISET